jgi:regulator of RNase E activity RraB
MGFHRDDSLADGRPDDFVAEIFELLAPFDGDYDGWGATHIQAS